VRAHGTLFFTPLGVAHPRVREVEQQFDMGAEVRLKPTPGM
jgi:hypothetical protein